MEIPCELDRVMTWSWPILRIGRILGTVQKAHVRRGIILTWLAATAESQMDLCRAGWGHPGAVRSTALAVIGGRLHWKMESIPNFSQYQLARNAGLSSDYIGVPGQIHETGVLQRRLPARQLRGCTPDPESHQFTTTEPSHSPI